MSQNSKPRKRRSQEGPRNAGKCRKTRKSKKDFSCQLKKPMTNIAKTPNSRLRNKKMAKKDLKKPANVAKVTRIFLAS